MPRIASLMTTGRRAMMNSQTGLHTVAHNIANKETEGFSRQRIETQSNMAIGSGRHRIGMGAKASSVSRVNNPYLERQLGNEKSELATAKGRQQMLSRLEETFNEQSVEGFNSSLTSFFNSFRELSTNPESMPRRTQVKAAAETLVRDIHSVNTQLEEISGDVNSQMEISVNEINALTDEVAHLNTQIQKVEISGGWANDERDRRDLLIKKLGEVIDIKWAEGEDSTVTVSTAGDALLVVGSQANHLDAVSTPATDTKREGDRDIVFYHHDFAEPMVITDRISGGRLGGVIDVRNNELAEMRNNMDQLAYTVSQEVNRSHAQGFNAYNQTNVDFFEPVSEVRGAAEYISLNSDIMGDAGRISAGRDPNRPGDNRVAVEIAELQFGTPIFDGAMSLNDFYNGMVGQLGIKAQAVNREVEVQGHLVGQLDKLRESISGVSLDEEAARMIEMQKHFDASARLIRTADEVLETVINLKRL